MTPDMLLYATAGALMASALVAGVFLTFSDFVMRSLSRAAPAAGAESMQIINREVFRSVFMVLLLGMAPVSAGIAAYALAWLGGAAQAWLVLAGAVYLSGVFAVTMFGNVPMNNRLDRMPTPEAVASAYWAHYATVWTRWNHLRTVASALAAMCYLMAMVALARG